MRKKSTAALGVAALMLAGCGASMQADGSSNDGGELVVGSFGGDYDAFLKDFVDPVFQESMNGTEVIYSSGDTAALKTKIIAEVDGEQGTFDVVQLSGKDLVEVKSADALMKLDPEKLENWDNIQPNLVDDYCVPHINSPITIMYNAEDISTEITTWDDFFQPSVAEQAGAWERWADYVFYGAAVSEADGDPGTDLSAGYDKAVAAGQLMRHYGSATQMGQALISGEISALVGVRARAAQWSSESGQDFASVVPEDGTRNYTSYSCIPANTTNVEAAYAHLDAQLDPHAQQGFAENMFYGPTITNADLAPEVEAAVGTTDEEASRIYSPDMAAINEALPEMRRLWNEEATR